MIEVPIKKTRAGPPTPAHGRQRNERASAFFIALSFSLTSAKGKNCRCWCSSHGVDCASRPRVLPIRNCGWHFGCDCGREGGRGDSKTVNINGLFLRGSCWVVRMVGVARNLIVGTAVLEKWNYFFYEVLINPRTVNNKLRWDDLLDIFVFWVDFRKIATKFRNLTFFLF